MPAQPFATISQSFSAIGAWAKRQRLRSQYKMTLARYEKQDFSIHTDLRIEDALTLKLLDPQYLHGQALEQMAPTLGSTVWDAWNKSSASRYGLYRQLYGGDISNYRRTYDALMPFEKLMYHAMDQENVAFFAWMHALPNPWRPIQWKPLELLGGSVDVGNWVLDTFTKLQVTPQEGEYLSKQLLLRRDRTHDIPADYRSIPTDVFSRPAWHTFREDPAKYRVYAQRVLDTLLPTNQWPWERRWSVIGKDMPLAITHLSDDHEKEVVAHRGCIMAALLHEAPMDIQQLLCAFKGARHPQEPSEGSPDAQYVRHRFFDQPLPSTPPSPVLSATFLCVTSVDPDVEVDFVVAQMLRDYRNETVESYTLDGLDLTA